MSLTPDALAHRAPPVAPPPRRSGLLDLLRRV